VIYQNAHGVLPDAAHYSCRFNFMARSREIILRKPWSVEEYNAAWVGARNAKIISGDLNGDGDFDDTGEDEILDDVALIRFLGLPLRVVPLEVLGLPTLIDARGVRRVAPTAAPLDPKRYWVGERWVWKIGHFVQGDGTGKAPAVWDPIAGGSLTRKNGVIADLRVFLIEEA